jgi:glyoxylase-like metal-dependent hydrolase (beta-lactamase superfamily II)
MPKLDYELFEGRSAVSMGPEMYMGVMADSVTPVMHAGLVKFIEPGDEVAGLVAMATPGHTPGHLAYTFRHRGDETIFSGDVLHSPVQAICPHVNSRWCEQPELARASRHKLLYSAAATNAAIIPAHAKGVHGWRIARTAESFSIGFDVVEQDDERCRSVPASHAEVHA